MARHSKIRFGGGGGVLCWMKEEKEIGDETTPLPRFPETERGSVVKAKKAEGNQIGAVVRWQLENKTSQMK